MVTWVKPGVTISIIDESFCVPSSHGTVCAIVFAKEQPDPDPLEPPDFGTLFDSVFLGSDGMFGGDN